MQLRAMVSAGVPHICGAIECGADVVSPDPREGILHSRQGLEEQRKCNEFFSLFPTAKPGSGWAEAEVPGME